MQYRTLAKEGNFYRGNLHTHTTLSDGQGSPEETVAYYRDVRKLDFLALTDHNLFRIHEELSTDKFLLLPGVELNTIPNENDRADHHVVGIGVEGEYDLADGTRFDENFRLSHDAQGLIDECNTHGLIPIFCHPFWSNNDFAEVAALKNVCGMEIMNFGCEGAVNDGNSEPWYEYCLLHDKFMWAFSNDDAHALHPAQTGGFIGVKASSLTNKDITAAIRAGSFYASMGPEIYDFWVEDEVAHLICSPVKRIYLNGHRLLDGAYALENEPLYTHFEAPLKPNPWRIWSDSPDYFVRATVIDELGRKAWTQPIVYKKREK